MKRYTLTALLLLFAVGGVGAYYVYASADRLPEFKLETIEGDGRIGSEIELSGSYSSGSMLPSQLAVTDEGSRYSSRRPFYENTAFGARSWFDEIPGIRELKRDHRSFMRGKGIPDGFLSDGEWVVYAEAVSETSNALQIETINEQKDEKASFVTELPDQAGLSRLYVADVQREGNELHVLTTYNTATGNRMPNRAYFDNVIELPGGELIRQQKLEPTLASPEKVQVHAYATEGTISPGDYAVLRVNEETTTYYSYSYKTGRMTKLQKPSTTTEEQSYSYVGLSGSRIVLSLRHEKEQQIVVYDPDSGKMVKEFNLTEEEHGDDQLRMARIRDSKIYMLVQQGQLPTALVFDLENGALLYKGKIVYSGPATEAEEAMKKLSLYSLSFRK